MIWGRRGKDDVEETESDSGSSEALNETGASGDPGLPERPRGPWDVSEVDAEDERMDLGGIRVRGQDGLQMQVQMDERTGSVSLVTLSIGGGAVQVQAFAAPRRTGIWDDVRGQLKASINAAGGLVEEVSGDFGPELKAKVPGQGGALQPARFVGVDGPRWFLRGLFLGGAADPGGNPQLEAVFRDIVVVRGGEAMAPGDALPLRLPDGAEATRAEG